MYFNTKRVVSVLLILAMLFSVTAFADETMEEGKNVYYITTAEELNSVRDDLSGTYYLMNDIDLSSYGDWIPVGHSGIAFSGSFDGQGYEITGMTIGNEEYTYTGLFGHVAVK